MKLRGQLKTAHALYPRLRADIQAGKYYLSSDSAGHLVKRTPMANGTNRLDKWALLTASLTKSPAEHRLLPVAAVKALNLKAGARHSAVDQTHIQTIHDSSVAAGALCGSTGKSAFSDRQRAMLIELDLLELETEAPAPHRPAEPPTFMPGRAGTGDVIDPTDKWKLNGLDIRIGGKKL